MPNLKLVHVGIAWMATQLAHARIINLALAKAHHCTNIGMYVQKRPNSKRTVHADCCHGQLSQSAGRGLAL